MTDKYSQVINVLENYKTISEISDVLGWEKGTTQHYCKRLEDLGYVEKEVKHIHGHPFMFKRLVEVLSADHIDNLHNRKCLHRTQISPNKAEVNAIYNKYLFGNISTKEDLSDRAQIISFGGDKKLSAVNAETKSLIEKLHETYSERKKSPRNYPGCSFGLVGW
jgi:hypothetical protein